MACILLSRCLRAMVLIWGIDSTQLVLALLVTQFVAFPSAIAYGRLAKRFGTRHMLMVGVFASFLS